MYIHFILYIDIVDKIVSDEYSTTSEDHNNGQLLLQKNEYEKYANKLEELSTTCKITQDYRDVFDDVSGSIFWDQGHIADAGNMIIAERIYEISLPIIQKNHLLHHGI